MTDDLVKRVRRIGIGSELGATTRDRTTAQEAADRIETLEAALRELDSMVSALDAGELELYQVGDFIDAALAGEKKE